MNNTLIIYDNANTKINNVLNKITEVQEITKKSDLYYYFININDEKSENVMNAAINIKRYIEEPKKA